MSSVGERLRLERQRQGLSLAQVADRTRISHRHLAAIEADDIKSLPGEFFYRAFVRQYAAALGLDEQDFESDFEEMFPSRSAEQPPIPDDQARKIDLQPMSRIRDNRTMPWSLMALALVVVACTALYAWWQKVRTAVPWQAPQQVVETRQVEVPRPVAQQPAQEPPAGAPSQPGAATPAESAAAAPPAPAPEVRREPPSSQTPAQSPAAVAPPPVVPKETPAVAGGDLVLEITASEDTWFRMRSGGQVQFNAVLKKGETRTLRGDGAADILVGNAGGLNIVWNGKPLGPIGPRGQVRTVKITAEGAQVTDPRAERKQSEEQPEQRQQM